MTTGTQPRRFRGAVLGCVLFGVAVCHVSLRYLLAVSFGFVTYRGLAPVVPWVLFVAYGVVLLALAGSALRRLQPGGARVSLGLLALAAEPLTSSVLWGDGCQVAGSGGSMFPLVTWERGAVVVAAWNGGCTASLNVLLVAAALLLLGAGLRRASVPQGVVIRWLAFRDRP